MVDNLDEHLKKIPQVVFYLATQPTVTTENTLSHKSLNNKGLGKHSVELFHRLENRGTVKELSIIRLSCWYGLGCFPAQFESFKYSETL